MDVIMPQMGESIAEGTIVKWLKKPGDTVEKDEPLFEISTDKVDAEIPSPADGTLSEILVEEGNTVEVNTVVAKISEDGEAEPSEEARKEKTPSADREAEPSEEAQKEETPSADRETEPSEEAQKEETPSAERKTKPSEEARKEETPSAEEEGGAVTAEERLQVRSSPLVRKMAAEHDVDITQVEGTGIHGRVTKADMEAYLDRMESGEPEAKPARRAAPAEKAAPAAPKAAPEASPTVPTGDRLEPMSIMRLKIAEHMVESRRTSAHVQTFWEVDVSHLAALRKSHGEEFLRQNGVKLSFTAFFAKAACDALKEHPIVNASIAGANIQYHGSVNLGIAVALDWGLIVPVIQDAGDRNLGGLAKAIVDLAGRARSKKLSPDEVTGGTFTITNPGIYGGLFGAPIINQPQSAILGLGAIEKRPVVVNDAIAIRDMCYISLSFDHRLIDGAVAEQFMSSLRDSLSAIDASSL